MPNENLCYFVNCKGLSKSCNFFEEKNPTFKNNKDYFNCMLTEMFDGMSIYVKSALLGFFVDKILLKITKKFVLVSGDSHLCVPKEVLNLRQFNMLLNSDYLIKWFAQNTRIQNNIKIQQLPIGLDYHTISENPSHKWRLRKEGYLSGQQEMTLVNIRQNMLPFFERIPKIYVNFTTSNDRFGQRKDSLKCISNELLEIDNSFSPRTINWKKTTNYAFVLSPFGVGMDCHRTWEALCLGCIPIVKAKHFTKLFEDLPVLILDDWHELNPQLLQSTINAFKKFFENSGAKQKIFLGVLR